MTIEEAAIIVRQMKKDRVEHRDSFGSEQIKRWQREAQALDILIVMAFSCPALQSETGITQA